MEEIQIYDKMYSLMDLQKIKKGKKDSRLKFEGEELDYICDNSTVEFYKVYIWHFRNTITNGVADVYFKFYPERSLAEFENGQDSVHYTYDINDTDNIKRVMKDYWGKDWTKKLNDNFWISWGSALGGAIGMHTRNWLREMFPNIEKHYENYADFEDVSTVWALEILGKEEEKEEFELMVKRALEILGK